MGAGQHFCEACDEPHYSTLWFYRDVDSESRCWRCVKGFFGLTILERVRWQEAHIPARSGMSSGHPG